MRNEARSACCLTGPQQSSGKNDVLRPAAHVTQAPSELLMSWRSLCLHRHDAGCMAARRLARTSLLAEVALAILLSRIGPWVLGANLKDAHAAAAAAADTAADCGLELQASPIIEAAGLHAQTLEGSEYLLQQIRSKSANAGYMNLERAPAPCGPNVIHVNLCSRNG